jgi:putative tricarboxylic transport membrane protein
MLLSRGDATVFFTEPLSATLLAMAAGLIVLLALPMIRKERDQVFVEEDT